MDTVIQFDSNNSTCNEACVRNAAQTPNVTTISLRDTSNNAVVVNTLTAPVPVDRMSFFVNIEYK